MAGRQGPRRPRPHGRRRRRDLLRARGRRDLPRRQGRAAAAPRLHRQDGPRGDAVPGPQPEPRRRRRASARSPSSRPAVQARYGEHPHLGQVWITPTVLRAGEPVQMNVMPAGASVWVDVRTIPAVDHADARRRGDRRRRRRRRATLGIATAVDGDRRPPERRHGRGRPAGARRVGRPRRRRAATRPASAACPGATDGTMHHVARPACRPSSTGPGGKWIAHQADEFVEVDDLVAHAEVYVEAADRFLRRATPSMTPPRATPGRATTSPTSPASPSATTSGAGRGWLTGTTVVLPPVGTIGGVDVRGGGPGTRETDLLAPGEHGRRASTPICLTGGSAYGLDAAGGVMAVARAAAAAASGSAPSRGHVVPIVPAAVVFDLGAGGSLRQPPRRHVRRAGPPQRPRPAPVRQGTVGAGTGAHAARAEGRHRLGQRRARRRHHRRRARRR